MPLDVPSAPIAVLGGSGFIGTRLMGRLIELGQNPRIGDLQPSQAFPDRYLPCDVRKADTLRTVLSGAGALINLAAEHRDDVRPISRYHETNVEGARQVCQAATEAGIQKLIFTSSVAVYGFHPFPVDESGPFEPFNPYGQTKLEAEGIYRAWAEEDPTRSLVIIRPTVVFGEGNRGNVYNLLRQIASGRFMMVGPGTNKKSMAYVGNVAEALIRSLSLGPGIHVFNYVDTPDMSMNELVALVNQSLGRPAVGRWRIPLPLAMAGGQILDGIARVTGRPFPISAIRVRKFCESTQFRGDRLDFIQFETLIPLRKALEKTIRSEFKIHSSQSLITNE
jgi:nucleoside-diphosphate-sugar epimerase